MLRKILWCVLLVLGAEEAAGTQRAVVVGISDYSTGADSAVVRARRLRDLPNAERDAVTFAELLRSVYGFAEDNIVLLTNAAATREAILNAVERHLVEASAAGDTAVFYYAGHGSQVYNSLSPEPDKLDETIVPADAGRGAADIRDKELRLLFNRILDKGASLTAVFDSCHSGSITRGLTLDVGPTRFAKPSGEDAADAVQVPDPASRGALILSSALDAQPARDGYFTPLLGEVLLSGGATSSADRVFLQLRARMLASGRVQEPVLEGTPARRMRPLIDDGIERPSDPQVLLAVLSIDASTNTLLLQGGGALNVTPGTRIVPLDGDAPVLTIDTVVGPERSLARPLSGEITNIEAGHLFRIDRLAATAGDALVVWAGDEFLPGDTASEMARVAADLRDVWVLDPTEDDPTHVVFWRDMQWWIRSPDGETTSLGPRLESAAVRAVAAGNEARVFVNWPADGEWHANLVESIESSRANVRLTDDLAEANYVLVGRWNGRPEYAWVTPGAAVSEWRSSLPIRSDWISMSAPDIASGQSALLRHLERAAQLYGWLSVSSPPGAAPFGYELVFVERRLGEERRGGPQRVGDRYDVVLRLRDDVPTEAFATLQRRFVYLLAIDSHGNSALIWPRPCTSGGEPLPSETLLDKARPEIVLYEDLRVSPPAGIDTIVFLTTQAPLSDACLLEADGIRTRSGAFAADPLTQLLLGLGRRTRGPSLVQQNWTIERLVFHTLE